MSKKKVLRKQLRAALFAIDLAMESIEMINYIHTAKNVDEDTEEYLSNNIEEIYEILLRIDNPELLKR